jgi:hypothetical protein
MNLPTVRLLGLMSLVCGIAHAAVPATGFYPYPGANLADIRKVILAESIPDSKELTEAWRLFHEIQGCWMPGRVQPSDKTIAQLDSLRGDLEQAPKPHWLIDTLQSPKTERARLAGKIGSPLFEKQKATADYQAQKALAIVYLAEHELDRPGAANRAGAYLTAITLSHPWDWEAHALYSRLLIDSKMPQAGLSAAIFGLFHNPAPSLEDLKYFAFVGATAAKEHWAEIQAAIRQAATDPKLAEQAIQESAPLYSDKTEVTIVPPK